MHFFSQFSVVRSALWLPRSVSLLAACRCEAVPTVGEDRIEEHLIHLDIHMGPDGMHLRVLEGLGNVTAMVLTLLKSHGSFKAGRFLMTTERQTLHPSSGRARRSI